jgi:hypothetical protein
LRGASLTRGDPIRDGFRFAFVETVRSLNLQVRATACRKNRMWASDLKAVAEARLEEGARGGIERLAGRAQNFVHDGRHGRSRRGVDSSALQRAVAGRRTLVFLLASLALAPAGVLTAGTLPL